MTSFPPGLLQDKVAFVAGASSGINLAIARRFGQAGAKLAIVSRDAQRIAAAARQLEDEGITVLARAADVRQYDAVAAVLAEAATRFGPIDTVVSGAAGNFHAGASSLSANAFRTVVEIGLIGNFNVLRASFEHLRKPGASLIAITAPGGTVPGMFQVHANAAKAGINMTMRCLYMEWGPAGIRANGLSPGPITGTPGMAKLAGDPAREQALQARLPLRAYGSLDDITDAALYLASDLSRYVTGTVLDCDGGMQLGDASGDALAPARAA
ncbi:MAG TPA: SDR family oxidoreductase [Pseudorhodoferax sp.]|nr:SDR family oxidoreductase [Pseudorhodoferax sp.]